MGGALHLPHDPLPPRSVFNDLLRSGQPDSARFDTLRFAQGPVVIQLQ